jgi:hypothetical protein
MWTMDIYVQYWCYSRTGRTYGTHFVHSLFFNAFFTQISCSGHTVVTVTSIQLHILSPYLCNTFYDSSCSVSTQEVSMHISFWSVLVSCNSFFTYEILGINGNEHSVVMWYPTLLYMTLKLNFNKFLKNSSFYIQIGMRLGFCLKMLLLWWIF